MESTKGGQWNFWIRTCSIPCAGPRFEAPCVPDQAGCVPVSAYPSPCPLRCSTELILPSLSALADLLPCVAITAATITLFDVEMNSFVRSSCVFAFVGAVWLVESVLSALSLLAACRYALQRKTRPANKASNIVCLVTFRFFSVIPCLQMVPSAYDSALLFVQELARQTYSDCLRNSNASTEDDLARHIRCESAAIGYYLCSNTLQNEE